MLPKTKTECGLLAALFLLLAIAQLYPREPMYVVEAAPQQERIVVELTAAWCEYCRALEPEVQLARSQGYNIQQVIVDGDKQTVFFADKSSIAGAGQSFVQTWGVKTIPHLVLLDSKTKQVIAQKSAANMTRKQLRETLDSWKVK